MTKPLDWDTRVIRQSKILDFQVCRKVKNVALSTGSSTHQAIIMELKLELNFAKSGGKIIITPEKCNRNINLIIKKIINL